MPIVAGVQTTPGGLPVVACLRQHSPAEEEVAVLAATRLATSATGVSDRLWCFRAATLMGAGHGRIVTGGRTA